MIHHRGSALSGFVNGLLSTGRTAFTADEAERAMGVGHGAFLDAAERLQRRAALFSPRQGLYVVVPPQYASWGAPPPASYIDVLMRYEDQTYYLGLLKAAELHGASHQAIMEFQVVSAKRFREIRAGRSLIAFYFRKDVEAVRAGIEERQTDTGTMMVSSVALTALDLLRYPRASGGIDNIAMVLSDLGPKIDPAQLAALSARVERPIAQRLGHLLDQLGYGALTGPMLEALRVSGPLRWTELERQEMGTPDFERRPSMRDLRWRVIVRRIPEVDD